MGTGTLAVVHAKAKLSILIADDNSFVRSGLTALLEHRHEWTIVGFARSGNESVEKARRLRPDLVIIDIDMLGLDGLEASSQILKNEPSTRILVLSRQASRESLGRAMALGIEGYVLHSDQVSYVADAIEAIQRGNSFFTPSASDLLRKGILQYPERIPLHPGDPRLSPREHDVVRLVADGNSNKEVASLLNISLRTAENHRAHAMRKLKLSSFSELVRHAVRTGLVAP
jgi:DNA-binding NarL/FixJ family response regulator